MALGLIITTLTLFVLLIASYCDLKKREVPDWLNYGFLLAVLGIRLIFSVEEGVMILLSGLLGLGAGFALASLFYYTRQWGGGDSKLLMGVGAALGIAYPWDSSSWDLPWFILSLFLLGAVYGLVWAAFLAVGRKEEFVKGWKEIIREYRGGYLAAGLFSLFFLIISFIFSFLWPLAIVPLLFFYLFIFISVVEKSFFRRRVPPKKLTEGDWLAEDIIIRGRKVLAKKTLEIPDLVRLKSLQREGKLGTVLIKEGVPLVPAFFLAYLLVAVGGSDLWSWLFRLFWA